LLSSNSFCARVAEARHQPPPSTSPRLHRGSHRPIDTPQVDALFPARVQSNPALFPRPDRYTLLRTSSARTGSGFLGSVRFATRHAPPYFVLGGACTRALLSFYSYLLSPRALPIRFAFPLPQFAPAPHWDLQHPSPPRSRTAAAAPSSPPSWAMTLRRLERGLPSTYDAEDRVHTNFDVDVGGWRWTPRTRTSRWRRR
jgi:hypothetical protein